MPMTGRFAPEAVACTPFLRSCVSAGRLDRTATQSTVGAKAAAPFRAGSPGVRTLH